MATWASGKAAVPKSGNADLPPSLRRNQLAFEPATLHLSQGSRDGGIIMKSRFALGAWALAALTAPVAALADDPRDPTMTPEAIARDRDTIRKMNLDQLAYVRNRDARYASGWQNYADRRSASQPTETTDYAARRRAYQDDLEQYREDRRRYDEAMADWRRDTSDCASAYDCGD